MERVNSPLNCFWFHRFSNGNLKNLEQFPWMQNDGCHRTSLHLPCNWALEKPLPLFSMFSVIIFGLRTTREWLKSSRGKKGTWFFQICFHEFHGFTLPETNSKSTWKWMVGRWSGVPLGWLNLSDAIDVSSRECITDMPGTPSVLSF